MKKTNHELKNKPEAPAISPDVSGAFNEIFHCIATDGYELSMLPGFYSGQPVIHLIAVDTTKGVFAPIARMYELHDLKHLTGPDNEPILEIPPDAATTSLVQ